ncbi:MAG: hypothetical protein ABDH32_04660 [Candidatus Caldarchaeales archaeon]
MKATYTWFIPLLSLIFMSTIFIFMQNTLVMEESAVDLELLLNSTFDPSHKRYQNYSTLEEYAQVTGDVKAASIAECIRELAVRWRDVRTSDPPPDEVIELSGEKILVWGCRGKFIYLDAYTTVRSEAEASAYISRRIKLLKYLASAYPDHVLDAVVSPIKPLTLEDYAKLIRDGINVTWTKYQLVKLKTGEYVGGGVFSFPTSIEDHIKRHHGNVSGLSIQILDFKVKASISKLMKLQENPLVLLVDVGPLDVVYKYVKEGAMVYIKRPFGGYLTEQIIAYGLTINKESIHQ